MKKKLIWLIPVLIAITLILSITVRQAVPPAAKPLSVEVNQTQVGPQVIRQNPIAGQRLDLSPTIQIVFDRDMDRDKTANAFLLLGSERQPVSGRRAWRGPRTFEFTPDSKLEPATVYKAVFSTQAAALDGTSPQENIELEFKTIDRLAVGQVFPAADAADVDSATNITAIFNQPVVPLTLREEQSGLPQPLEFTPAVAGHGEWVSSSVYVYQPDQALLSGTRYTVRVDAGLKAANGDALDKSFVWQFDTRAPYIQNYALQNGENNPGDNIENVLLNQVFVVTFSQPMNQKSVAQALTVTDRETGQNFPLQLKWDKTSSILSIAPSGKFQIASFYQLNLADAALAQDGGRLKEGLSLKFSTVPLPAIVKVTPEPNSEATNFDSSMTIKFASPMKFDSTKGKVQIKPAPKTEPQMYYNSYERTLNIWGLEPATDY